MGIETASYIVELVPDNPSGVDDFATADNHLRLIKLVLQTQFPNFGPAAITPTEEELNFVDGVTSAIQAQLDAKAAAAHAHTADEISDLDVLDITTGIFASSFIPSLNASKINAGTFAAARIPTHTGDVIGQTALSIVADAVTYAKMQNVVADDRILGNVAGAGGIVAELTAAAVRTMINVEDGATAGGGSSWTLETESFTLASGDQKSIEATAAAVDATLPGTIAAGDEFIVHNASTSTKVVQIEPNGHSIIGAGGTVTPSDTLVLALGDTAHLVAISSSVLEVV